MNSKQIMESAALKLFKKSDHENKGFIVKRDMQRMKDEISLTPEQLEMVFDTLDADKSGYLTMEQFLKGFREYLMVSRDSARGSSIADYEDESFKAYDDNTLADTLNLIKGTNILKTSAEDLEYISEQMKDKSGSQIAQWEILLKNLHHDLQTYKDSHTKLEKLMKQKDYQHQTYMRKMFEELERELREEKEKDKFHEQMQKRIKDELKIIQAELLMKDELLQKMNIECREVKKQLLKLQLQEEKTKSLNCTLMDKQNQYESQLETEHLKRDHIQTMLDNMKRRFSFEKSQCFKDGFHLAKRVVNVQEEGLLQQLHMLEDMQRVLENRGADQR